MAGWLLRYSVSCRDSAVLLSLCGDADANRVERLKVGR